MIKGQFVDLKLQKFQFPDSKLVTWPFGQGGCLLQKEQEEEDEEEEVEEEGEGGLLQVAPEEGSWKSFSIICDSLFSTCDLQCKHVIPWFMLILSRMTLEKAMNE